MDETIIFDERSLPDPPDGKKRHRRFGIFFLLNGLLLLFAIFILHTNITLLWPSLILFVVFLIIIVGSLILIFGYDELIVYNYGIQYPIKILIDIYHNNHTILHFKDIMRIEHWNYNFCPWYTSVFIITDLNLKQWKIMKCFVTDIDSLSNIFKEICYLNNIQYIEH